MTSVICDLDGVVYTGDEALPGSADALRRLAEAGVPTWFATNNSTRTAQATASKVTRATGVHVEADRVITSAHAAASLLGPDVASALVVGGAGIVAALEEHGIMVTDDPLEAAAVVVGMDQGLTYEKIARAADAIRNGALFVASNDDATYPSPDGPLPGAGAVVAAIATASGVAPTVAGKPNQPMRELLKSAVGDHAWVIGDRVETDIAMASAETSWTSVLVLSGVTRSTSAAADHVTQDLDEAVDLVLSSR